MNKMTVYTLTALLAFAPFAAAQTQAQTRPAQTQPGPGQNLQGQPGGPGGRNPAFAATFDLLREVNGLRELNKDPKTAINKAQAAKLLPILRGLQSAKLLPAAAATKTLTQLEAVLSDTQLTALDALALKRQQGGRGFGPGGQRPGGQGQGGQGGFGQGQGGQGGQGGANGNGARRPGGFARTPGMNPFLQGRGSDGLKTLIADLSKTAK